MSIYLHRLNGVIFSLLRSLFHRRTIIAICTREGVLSRICARNVTKIQFQNVKSLTQLRHRNVRLAVHQKLAGLHCTKSDDSFCQELDCLRSGSVLRHRILLQTGKYETPVTNQLPNFVSFAFK